LPLKERDMKVSAECVFYETEWYREDYIPVSYMETGFLYLKGEQK